MCQAPAEEEDQAYEIDFSIRLDVNIVDMRRFTLAVLLVIALANPSLSCSKSQNPGEGQSENPGKPFEIWSIDLLFTLVRISFISHLIKIYRSSLCRYR